MKTHAPALKRLLMALAGLALAGLACSRAESAIAPAPVAFATPLPGVATRTPVLTETPTETSIATEPLATATEAVAYPAPDTETPSVESSPTPESAASATPETEATPTAEPTTTPPPTTGGGGGIPPDATFTQSFDIAFEGGILFGLAQDMIDGNETTWASLRAGNTYWVFDLGVAQNVAGLRLYPRRDGQEDVTLLLIEVSADGATWTPAYTGQGNCGDTPACDILPVDTTHDIGFGPVSAQYVRMQAGPAPARFAFGEVQIAVVP